jgi:hypothetical protein
MNCPSCGKPCQQSTKIWHFVTAIRCKPCRQFNAMFTWDNSIQLGWANIAASILDPGLTDFAQKAWKHYAEMFGEAAREAAAPYGYRSDPDPAYPLLGRPEPPLKGGLLEFVKSVQERVFAKHGVGTIPLSPCQPETKQETWRDRPPLL